MKSDTSHGSLSFSFSAPLLEIGQSWLITRTMRGKILKYHQQQFTLLLGRCTHTCLHLMFGKAPNIHHGCMWAKKTKWRCLKRRTKQRRSETNKVNKTSWFVLEHFVFWWRHGRLPLPSCSPSSFFFFFVIMVLRLPLCCNQPTLFLG